MPNHIEKMLVPNLQNWENLRILIQSTKDEILQVAHTTVQTKLHYANMQLNLLNQVYEPPSSFEKMFMKRSIFESIIINLVSALESTAHVMNQIYELGIDYKQVTIDHKFFYNERRHNQASRNCLRCKIKDLNPKLASFLDEALQRGSPSEQWYEAVMEYRHQIVHRPHFIAMQIAGGPRGYFLPDDPKIMTQKVTFDKKIHQPIYSNFTLMREMKQFAESSASLILFIVEEIHGLILDDNKIKERMKKFFEF
jgi:hypothetical protein